MFEFFIDIKEYISNYIKKVCINAKKKTNHINSICPPYYAPFRYS